MNIKKQYKSAFSMSTLFLNKNLLLSLLGILILASCQEPLEYDYSRTEKSVLNVEGKITTDTTSHLVILSRTIPLHKNEVIWETDAVVTISDGSNVITLTENTPGHYYTSPDIYGVIGNEYTLNIRLLNGENYSASTKINNISEIDSILFSYEEFENYDLFFHFLYFFGWEQEEEGNAYRWNLTMNDTLYNDTLWKTTFVNDDFVNGQYIGASYNPQYKGSFAIYTLDPMEINNDTNHVTVEMESVPNDYYNFWNTFMQQTVWVGSPFDANKADPLSNITNGGMGFFYGASIKRYSFIYIRPEESKEYDPTRY